MCDADKVSFCFVLFMHTILHFFIFFIVDFDQCARSWESPVTMEGCSSCECGYCKHLSNTLDFP